MKIIINPYYNMEEGDECYCLVCNKIRKIKEVKHILPEFTEVQIINSKIFLSCGHRLSIEISNYFEE